MQPLWSTTTAAEAGFFLGVDADLKVCSTRAGRMQMDPLYTVSVSSSSSNSCLLYNSV
jgi:hypothetical protein